MSTVLIINSNEHAPCFEIFHCTITTSSMQMQVYFWHAVSDGDHHETPVLLPGGEPARLYRPSVPVNQHHSPGNFLRSAHTARHRLSHKKTSSPEVLNKLNSDSDALVGLEFQELGHCH